MLAPLDYRRRIYSYVDRGRYAQQMRRVFDHFPRQQVLALRCTDLWSDHVATLARITEFLGIKSFADIAPIHEFKGVADELVSVRTQEDLDFIAEQVAADVAAFSEMTEINVSDWPVVCNRSAAALKPVDV